MRETSSYLAKSQVLQWAPLNILWLLCALFVFSPLFSETTGIPLQENKLNPVKVTLIAEETSIQPGHPFWIAIRLQIKDEWHAYWKNPGGIGMPPTIKWQLPEGFKASEIYWPIPERFVVYDEVSYVYKNEVWLLAKVLPPDNLPVDTAITLFGDVEWLVCSDMACLPGKEGLSLQLKTSKEAPEINDQWAKQFSEAREKLPRKHNQGIPAQFKDGNLIISIPKEIDSAGLSSISYITFFPEDGGIVDMAVEPVLHKDEKGADTYQVILKASSENQEIANNHVLKGTMVFHSQKESASLEAWDMEVPIVASFESAVTPQEVFAASLFAFLGGLLLNLMPCVLPVISIKILSFVKLAKENRSLIFKHGLLFSLGVVVSFWALAATLLILQAYGDAVGWGFQLQNSLFVAILAALLFVFSLNFFGVYEIGTLFASWAGQKQHSNNQHGKLLGSFLSGVLATAVATPCTGPFLGSAVGFAVTLPAPQAMLIFTFLGLGMASPYLFLSLFPTLIRWIPKPGPWMVTFKEIMGFLLMATVLWLIWVFSAQTSFSAASMLLAAMLFLSVACWVVGKWSMPINKPITRMFGYAVALSFTVVAIYAVSLAVSPQLSFNSHDSTIAMASPEKVQNAEHTDWEPFSLERIEELQKSGTPFLIDFTARWCLICQTNHMVLTSGEVQKKLHELGVVTIKADWTKNDPVITKVLRKFGRSGVPLYLLYGTDPKKEPYVLPQLLTPDNVLEYLKKIEAEKIQKALPKSEMTTA